MAPLKLRSLSFLNAKPPERILAFSDDYTLPLPSTDLSDRMRHRSERGERKSEACLRCGLAGQFYRRDMEMKVRMCAVHSRVGRALENLSLRQVVRKHGVKTAVRWAEGGSQVTDVQIACPKEEPLEGQSVPSPCAEVLPDHDAPVTFCRVPLACEACSFSLLGSFTGRSHNCICPLDSPYTSSNIAG